jgi:guanosine-3',5'-bis(diphosphate) 3'-pyrophosphohydrolase
MTPLEERAYAFAAAAHYAVGQTRKYSGEPYIVHPMEVAAIVKTVPHTEEMVAAAYLHDVVEDTQVPIDVILAMFGPTVAEYVHLLTDPPKGDSGLNRKARKALSKDRLANAPAEVQTIKYADFIANTGSIVERDPSFAKVYLEEKRMFLDAMDKGDATLRARAMSIVNLDK